MGAYDLIVVNGQVVSASDLASYSIGVKDGKIAALRASFSEEELEGAQVIDAE